MKLEEQVAAYYTRGALEERILEALRSEGRIPPLNPRKVNHSVECRARFRAEPGAR